MNGPLHLFLNDLVGNAQQLVITSDNAGIPMDAGCSSSEEFSLQSSNFCSYGSLSDENSLSCSCLTRNSFGSLGSNSSSRSSGSSSRWDNADSPVPKEKLQPKLPKRRKSAYSPPPSPRRESRVTVEKSRVFEKGDSYKYAPSCGGNAANSLSLTKVAAMRMPSRSKGPAASPSDGRRKLQSHALFLSGGPSPSPRHVGDILSEAIRELGISEEELHQGETELAQQAKELIQQQQQQRLLQ